MFKTDQSKLTFITIVFTILFLISLPRIPIKVESEYLSIDSYIGGYIFNIPFTNSILDYSELKQGLDIKGGIKVVLKLDTSSLLDSEKEPAMESVKNILERRVNFLGVSETNIVTSRIGDEYRVTVEIPGQLNAEQAIQNIGSTAQLKFRVLASDIEWPIKDPNILQERDIFVDTDVTGKDLISADVTFDNTTNNPLILLRFKPEGKEKFSKILQENINKPVGIFLDDTLLQTPVVSPDIANSPVIDPTISGISLEEARNLSSLLRAGALPVPIEIIEQNIIGPSLGEDSIKNSLIAGLLGLLIVGIFLIFNYGKLGIVANLVLFIYVFSTLAIFKIFNVVLTLPGIAGFIFSIGVACDASILIFERIKEEIRWGRPEFIAIKNGYERAWSSIRDSNFSSIFSSFILFQFGSGFIRGFALTLIIGILVSIVTNVFISRVILNVFFKGKIVKND